MADERESGLEPAPLEPPRRRERLAELLVFLFLIVPSMFLSFFGTASNGYGFVLTAVGTIVRDLALLCLILFFVWRNAEPKSRIGWTARHALREVIIGVLLFVVVIYVVSFVQQLFKSAGLTSPEELPSSLMPKGALELGLAGLLVVVVAIAEETIFRGYMILRLTEVTRSVPAAVVLSAVIFSLGHGYEGSAGAATVGVLGLIFALIYVWRGSLVAPMVIHFLQDFVVLVIAPVIGAR